jgi:SAM-dependent methyltransferase
MAGWRDFLRTFVSRRKWLLIGYFAAMGVWSRLRLSRGRIENAVGSSHSELQLEQSLAYIDRVFDEYVRYGKLGPDDLQGRRFLELGVGDNIGVALRFLAAGAREYACLDQFYSVRDVAAERKIYLALRERIPGEQRARFDAAVALDHGIALNPTMIRTVYGKGAQEADRVFPGEQFDFILSRAVIHEVYEIDGAFAAMDKLLAPGGMLLHKIDLRDYGMLSAWGFHPREFLTIPHWIYALMVRNCGKPNRRLIDYYRDKMRELGYCADLSITCLVDPRGYRGVQEEFDPPRQKIEYGVDYSERHRSLIAEIRPRLRAQFRDLSDEDLLAAGVFLAARKPRL